MKIEIKNISKKFNDTHAVKNLSFAIEENKNFRLTWPKWMWKDYFYWNVFRSN